MEDLDTRISAAYALVSDIESRRDAEAREAELAIHAKYADELSTANRELYAAKQAKRDHTDATAAHPWDGKRVFLERPTYDRWSRRQTGVERLEGIVEVVRQSSNFAENLTKWSRPGLGTVIVRKLKKDGTASLQFHKLWGGLSIENWKLA